MGILNFDDGSRSAENSNAGSVLLSQTAKDQLVSLIRVEESDLRAIKQIDENIIQIQNSTRTFFPFLLSFHNKLRGRYSWYYSWHLNRFSNAIHIILTVGLILGFVVMLMTI